MDVLSRHAADDAALAVDLPGHDGVPLRGGEPRGGELRSRVGGVSAGDREKAEESSEERAEGEEKR